MVVFTLFHQEEKKNIGIQLIVIKYSSAWENYYINLHKYSFGNKKEQYFVKNFSNSDNL